MEILVVGFDLAAILINELDLAPGGVLLNNLEWIREAWDLPVILFNLVLQLVEMLWSGMVLVSHTLFNRVIVVLDVNTQTGEHGAVKTFVQHF